MRGFERRGLEAVARLEPDERPIIAALVAEVRTLVGSDSIEAEGRGPDDPAVLRLFPDAAPQDPEAGREFRRLTEPDLRTLKSDRLDTVLNELAGEGPEWVIPLDRALATAAALTDVRLVIATRLGLQTDEDAELLRGELDVARGLLQEGLPDGLGVDQERLQFATLYQALTWLQESLIACLMETEG